MENEHGDTSSAAGLESTDSGSASADLSELSQRECLDKGLEAIYSAEDRLNYGRRQEAEEAIEYIKVARTFLSFLRETLDG